MAETTQKIGAYDATGEKPKGKELEPVTVDFSLRTVSNFLSRDNGTDWTSIGGKDLPIPKSGITFYKYEVEGQDGRGLIDKFAGHRSNATPLNERKVDYSSYFEAESLGLLPSFARATQGDTAAMNSLPIKSGRPFIHIETKTLNADQVKQLILSGYPLYSAALPDDHELIFRDWQGNPILDGAKERRSRIRKEDRNFIEPIAVGNQPVLWEDKQLSQNDDLLNWLGGAYLRFARPSAPGAIINLPDRFGGVVTNVRQRVLIGQSLAHLLGRPITYHTEDANIKTYYPKELGFSQKAENLGIAQDTINPLKRIIAEVFQKPWPEAHREWTTRKASI